MSLTIGLPWVTLFLLLSMTMGLVAIVFSILLRSNHSKLAVALAACSDEVRILTNSSVGVGKRIVDMENELQKLAQLYQHTPLTEQVRSTYNHASALLKRGASLEEVVRTCEISRAEVEFLYKISVKYN